MTVSVVLFIPTLLMLLAGIIHSSNGNGEILSNDDQQILTKLTKFLEESEKGITYTRWGKDRCKNGAETVYTGRVGGNHNYYKGGGVNYLCLPDDAENGEVLHYGNNQIYGAEYATYGKRKPSGWHDSLYAKGVPCAVCLKKSKNNVLMIPGREHCFSGWTSEYHGYLLSDHNNHGKKDFVCVDIDAEAYSRPTSRKLDGALFYPIRVKCGSLNCPPYKAYTSLLCVVCSK